MGSVPVPVDGVHSREVNLVLPLVKNSNHCVDGGCPLRNDRQYSLVLGTLLRFWAYDPVVDGKARVDRLGDELLGGESFEVGLHWA